MPAGHLLIVEDDDLLSEGLVAYFQMRGYSVAHVKDSQGALKALERKRPDLILAAHTIRPHGGLVLLEAVRSRPGTADVPFVLMSSRDGTVPRESRKKGADAVFLKPFSLAALAEKIDELLA